MARKDYYAILGIPKNASPDEVKKAFRALALRYHPDRNPGDAEAERRFREVAEAWDVLGDAETRSRYDRLGPLFTPSGRPPRPDELNEILFDALNGLFGRRRPGARGEDLRYTVSLSLEQAAAGCKRSIVVHRIVRCRGCDGSGDHPEGRKPCEACGGSGKAAGRRLFRSDCPHCDGRGYRPAARCERCGGEGRHPLEETLKINVPAGVASGQKIRVKEKGNEGTGGGAVAPGAPGDLFVLIAVDEHGIFRRRGSDLLCEIPVTFVEATLGADLVVPTLDGTTTIRVPPGTPSGKTFRLPGRGLPAVKGGSRGDLHARVVVEVPEKLDDAARAALLGWAERAGLDLHPKKRAWAEALRGRAS